MRSGKISSTLLAKSNTMAHFLSSSRIRQPFLRQPFLCNACSPVIMQEMGAVISWAVFLFTILSLPSPSFVYERQRPLFPFTKSAITPI